MNRVRAYSVVVFKLVLGVVGMCQTAPEWSKRTFQAPPDRVFAAALNSIAAQHHEVRSSEADSRVVSFHVGPTAWSLGYNMVLKETPGAANGSEVSVEIARSGGKAVSWGSGKKEVRKIFDGVQKELAKGSTTSCSEPQPADVVKK